MTAFIVWVILQSLLAFLIGTLFFDVFHYFSHQALKSKYKPLRYVAHLHNAHHQFFSSSLKIRKELIKKNFFHHVLIEYTVQLIGIMFCLFFLNHLAVFIAMLYETSLFIFICYKRGIDPHHMPYHILPSYRGGLYVSAEYHALHHIYPNNFFSSYLKILDWLLGTGNQMKGKRIAMTGASGALGSHMKELLEKEGAIISTFKYGTDYTYDNYQKLENTLKETDILFLCHGSKYENAQQANCDSFIEIIERFKSVKARKLVPLEIWGVGSEIECHPCFGFKKLQVYANSKRNYARKAKTYFHDKNIQYRHIVHSAFMSKMGPGLMSSRFAAKCTLFLLKRGFKYVPVTYTGIAFLNYFRFIKK